MSQVGTYIYPWRLQNAVGKYVCKTLCHTLEGYDSRFRLPKAYEKGYKKCHKCECLFKVDYSYCKCCKARLRTNSRSSDNIERTIKNRI